MRQNKELTIRDKTVARPLAEQTHAKNNEDSITVAGSAEHRQPRSSTDTYKKRLSVHCRKYPEGMLL